MNGMCKKRFYLNRAKLGHGVAALIEENIRKKKGDEGKLGGVDKRNKKSTKKSAGTTGPVSDFPASWNNLYGI